MPHSSNLERIAAQVPGAMYVQTSSSHSLFSNLEVLYLGKETFGALQVRFYAVDLPFCFVRAEVYSQEIYQFSLAANRGKWDKRFAALIETVRRIADYEEEVDWKRLERQGFMKFTHPLVLEEEEEVGPKGHS